MTGAGASPTAHSRRESVRDRAALAARPGDPRAGTSGGGGGRNRRGGGPPRLAGGVFHGLGSHHDRSLDRSSERGLAGGGAARRQPLDPPPHRPRLSPTPGGAAP